MNTRRRLATLALAGAMSSAISVGAEGTADAAPITTAVTPTTAAMTDPRDHRGESQAAPGGYAHLTIRSLGNNRYSVTISGKANLTSVREKNISFSLYGDDAPRPDPNLFDKNFLTTSSTGSFWVQFTLPGYTLNEDWGQDEVYAKAHVWDPSKGGMNLRTNTVRGNY